MQRKFKKAWILTQFLIPSFTDDTSKQQEHTEEDFHSLPAGLKTLKDLKNQKQNLRIIELEGAFQLDLTWNLLWNFLICSQVSQQFDRVATA